MDLDAIEEIKEKLIREHLPDLILIDINMPIWMDGNFRRV